MNEEWREAEPALDSPKSAAGVDLVGLLLRRKWLILFTTALGMGVGYLYYSQAEPLYESVAQILIVKKEANVPFDVTQGNDYQDSLDTHMLLLRSVKIVQDAVRRHNLQELPSFADGKDPTSEILRGMNVVRAGGDIAPNANVLAVTYEGTHPRDCAQILNAILATYQEFLGETYQSVSQEVVRLIAQARDELEKELQEKMAEHRKLRQTQDGSVLTDQRTGASTNVYEERLREIESRRAELDLEIVRLKSLSDTIRNGRERGLDQKALSMLMDKGMPIEFRDNAATFAEKLLPLKMSEQSLLTQFAEDHPRVREIRKSIELMEQTLRSQGMYADRAEAESVMQQEADVDMIGLYLIALTEQIRSAEEESKELNRKFDETRNFVKDHQIYRAKEENLLDEISRKKELYNTVIAHLSEIQLIKDYGGYSTQIISEPRFGWQTYPELGKILGIAGVIGLAVGFGLAYLIELADKSFRSPDEIRKRLGVPVIGHIPILAVENEQVIKAQQGDEQFKVDPICCAFHRPKSRMSEAYRAVRTSLYFSIHGEGHKVLQITSPDPGDGKTTLAANLAVSIAQSGKKVLLVDTDFRRPRIHKIFSVDNEVGVSSLMNKEAELDAALKQTPVDNLWVMPCGPKPNNPSELLTQPEFDEMIRQTRSKFDFVLLDTPPLLAVTDPCAVAPRVDGVLLTIRITKKARPNAIRASEMLSTLGAKLLGVIVNGVGRRPAYGGQYYGSKQYAYAGGYYGGYGYNYDGYGYGYGYGYDAYQNYYVDDESRRQRAAAVNGAAGQPEPHDTHRPR